MLMPNFIDHVAINFYVVSIVESKKLIDLVKELSDVYDIIIFPLSIVCII